MSKAVVAVFGLVILATMGVFATQAALEDAGEDRIVVNETWTPDAGNITTLDESKRKGAYYSHNVTVYDENGTEMEHGTDYDWFIGNGTVKALTGGGLDGDSDATITYGYQQTTAEQRQLAAALANLPQALGLLAPLALVIMFFAFLQG